MKKEADTIESVATTSTVVETVVEHGNEFGDAYAKAAGDRYEVTSAHTRQMLIVSGLVKPVDDAQEA